MANQIIFRLFIKIKLSFTQLSQNKPESRLSRHFFTLSNLANVTVNNPTIEKFFTFLILKITISKFFRTNTFHPSHHKHPRPPLSKISKPMKLSRKNSKSMKRKLRQTKRPLNPILRYRVMVRQWRPR